MAIVQTTETIDGRDFLYTRSDADMAIRQDQTGMLYQDALDVIPCRYTYTETDQPIDPDASSEDIYAEAGRIMLGEI